MSKRDGGLIWSQESLSLRDLFAAAAIAGIIAKGMNDGKQWDHEYLHTVASLAYGYADSLLAVRGSDNAWTERSRRVTIACEELHATLYLLWPGQDAVSKICRTSAIEALFGTRSPSAVEHLSAEAVESGVQTLRAFETVVKTQQLPTSQAGVIALILGVQQQAREAQVM